MKTKLLLGLLLLSSIITLGQERYPKNLVSINAFRNPSIGLEYHRKQGSIHAGYYLTNFESGVTTEFFKTGVAYWFLPFGKNEIPSSLYVGASYLRGLTREYKNENAYAIEAGARIMIWKGLQFRLGIIGLGAEGKSFKINPTPSINYSFKLK